MFAQETNVKENIINFFYFKQESFCVTNPTLLEWSLFFPDNNFAVFSETCKFSHQVSSSLYAK